MTVNLMTRGMTAGDVAVELGYLRRDGTPNTALVFRLTREADDASPFPQPINPRINPRLWRWPRVQIEAYGDGNWPVTS